MYINKVTNFRVASASYYWSRAATATGRLAQVCLWTRSDIMARAGCRRCSSRGERTRLPCSVGFVLGPLQEYLSPQGRQRGAIRSRGQGSSSSTVRTTWDLSSEGRLVHQTDRRSHQGTHEHPQFRRGTGLSDARLKRPRARKTFLSPLQLFVVASQRRCKKSANQREVLSLVLFTDEALQLCDGDAFTADSATNGRTGKRMSHRDRRLGTSTWRRKTPRSLEIQVVQP